MTFYNGLKEVYSKPFYVFVALAGIFLFYLVDVILSDFSDLTAISNQGSLKLLFYYFIGYPSTLDAYSNFFLFTITILFGSYISLATYKTNQIKIVEKHSFLNSLGIFLGFLAPGCAACGLGLASFLGIGGALILLPFNGKEISVISFLLLTYANLRVAKKIDQNTCSLTLK